MKQLTTVRSLSAIIVLFLLTALSASAQTHTPKSVYINDKIKGFWEYLPEGYNASSSQTYPLIISFHGAGERGSGSTTDLNKVLIHGVPKMIKNGTFPKSFTVNNETHRFIVLSPQLVDVATALQVNEFLDYAIRNYRVDPTRIYLTGLSMGGGMQYLYMGLYSAHAQRVAAMVPICEAYGYDVRIAQNIAKNGVAVWGLTNKTDNVVSPSLTINYINAINANNPVHRARLTVFDASGHDAWSRVYDVNYRENGMNIFEWMLQYKKGSTTTPTNQAPTANAGTDKNITLPTSSVSMTASASDADGTIASYSWSQVSGPASASFSSTTVLNPTISNLVAGTYTFRLTVKDNAGATKTDDVIVTVNNAPVNEAPSAYAGGDKKLYLPTNSTLMTSTASDADGTITAYNWSKVAGPSSYSFSSTTTLKPTVSNLTPGTYTFRLTVTDNAGAAVSDDVNIVVEDTTQATNEAPAANAGSDKSITLPANSTTLSGSGTDADGSIASYTW
ncbi:MAG TPA: PKD domain-containing protein, partial [Chitinophagaceae bacterium]|nr:PKD domain-containing protein [Chitinophagaceae bacterium]